MILVTGCAGFIGHSLCQSLLDLGLRVVGLDELNDFYDPSIKDRRVRKLCQQENFTFLGTLDEICQTSFSTVFHRAAQANVRYCEDNPEETTRCNQRLTQKLLASVDSAVHIIFVSSSSVYGKAPPPWGPSTQPLPVGQYGISKLECEALLQKRGAPATIIRPFSVVGPEIRPDLAPSIFMDRIIHRDTIEIYGDGSARRDFTHVDDLVQILVNTMHARSSAKDIRIYTVGNGSPRSIKELVDILQEKTGKSARVVHTKPTDHELAETFADNSAVKKEFGFCPRVDALEAAIHGMMFHPRPIRVVVVVATRNREALLRTRSLPSIQRQTAPPDQVCIVVDEDEDYGMTSIEGLESDFPEFKFVRNSRSRGASGAWNCGVFELTSLPEAEKYCYLAILDDDDAWEPNHLEQCLAKVQNGFTDWVVSGIIRHDDQEPPQEQTIPDQLQQQDFFVRNPHVQGSNLFLSLRLFYRAGMFDEYLPSCTDRDLCIRLFDVTKEISIRTTGAHTVHHFADLDRLRLSMPLSREKKLGVLRFSHKHLRRMSKEQQEGYWKRADALFSVKPDLALAELVDTKTERKLVPNHLGIQEIAAADSPLLWTVEVTSILFGVVSDKPEVISGLIQDISSIPNARTLVLANAHSPGPFDSLLRAHGVIGSVLHHDGDRLSIAEARTRLQVHCGVLWKKLISIDAVVIMDDDKRMPPEWYTNLCTLLRSEEQPDGGFLGPDIDAPPLPAAFVARTSMIDMFYSKLGDTNARCNLEGQDLFYDLGDKSKNHLEFPMACTSIPTNPLDSILKGIPIARKAAPIPRPEESTERGGCCVILDPDLLIQYQNPRVEVGGVVARRSDMLWVKLTKKKFVKHPALSVYHDRTKDKLPEICLFLKTAQADLLGAAMCRPSDSRESFLRQRLKLLGANILRIQGLEAALGLPPQLHFCYQKWVDLVIRPIINDMEKVKSAAISKQWTTISVADEFVLEFRKNTAAQTLLNEFPEAMSSQFIGIGSEGVVFTSPHTPELKYKVLDCYRPRDSTFSGNIQKHFRKTNSTILVSPFVQGEPYAGGNGPGLVQLLRQIQDDQHVCYRNWKPENVIVNREGLHFIDIGRDTVAYCDSEFEKMVGRAYLSWRFPNHGDELKTYCRRALTERIPQLDLVDLMFEAIADKKPDLELYDLVRSKLGQLRFTNVLDFGSGKAKFQRHTGIKTSNYDPKVQYPNVVNSVQELSGPFDVVLCLRVLCVLPPDEFACALAQVRELVRNDSGRIILTACDPRGSKCNNHEECFEYNKRLSTGRSRPEWYRPVRVLRTELRRAGFEILEEFIFWRVDQDRFEKQPNQWCCIAKTSNPPRHTLMIKTCLMDHATIEQRVHHLVETLPCGTLTLLVVDGKKEDFVRQFDQPDEAAFREVTQRLLQEQWIDQLLEAPTRDEICDIHKEWFGFVPEFSRGAWTHDDVGVQYASTFHGFNHCETDFALQVDSDLMVFRGNQRSGMLPFFLFDEDPLVLTWALPIANKESRPHTTGHRLEVRGCLLSLSRLKRVFQSSLRPPELVGRMHWYRVVDEIIGDYKSYRGGHQNLFFVHPPNEIKKNIDQYLLAIDAVQSGRLHPRQYGSVDWVGWPTEQRDEPIIIVVCGRNVAAGRMVRCIDSIRRNLVDDVGLVVIDDSSSRQTAEFLHGLLPTCNTTFVSRRRRVGFQANLLLSIRVLCGNPRSVICTVDLDDALLGKPIKIVRNLYEVDQDLEAAFGGLVHTKKPVQYAIDASRPVPPRDARGEPFWTHLRTFRKFLFDSIRVSDLGADRFHHLGTDWAFSVPIWEQARKTKALEGDLYLYEPDTPKNRDDLEASITEIIVLPPYSRRRYTVAVVGDSTIHRPEAFEVGFELAKAGYIVLTGGLGGVMEEACRGAKKGRGITVGILPSSDPNSNPHVDVPIPTGMGQGRNGIVALASAVVVVGGRAGTQSEVALAWSARRLVIAMKNVEGLSNDIAEKRFDSRRRYRNIPEDRVYGAETAQEVITLLDRWLPKYQKMSSRL
jgi:uncharacterized protein (TIGR00725 family)